MNDDIVERLRIIWTSCSDRINNERAAAADEIERLRKENTDLRWRLCKVLADSRECDADDIAKEKGWDDLVG